MRIRFSPDEKAKLRAAARVAGADVESFVHEAAMLAADAALEEPSIEKVSAPARDDVVWDGTSKDGRSRYLTVGP